MPGRPSGRLFPAKNGGGRCGNSVLYCQRKPFCLLVSSVALEADQNKIRRRVNDKISSYAILDKEKICLFSNLHKKTTLCKNSDERLCFFFLHGYCLFVFAI